MRRNGTVAEPEPLIEETPAGESSALTMVVPRQALLVRRSLEGEKSDLEKLATKVNDSGYPREARRIRGDASTIAEDLLPQLESQRELELTTPEEVRFGIMARIRGAVHPYMRDARPGEDDPEANCLESLAARIEAYARDLADHAYQAGVTARSHEPDVLAFRALPALGDA